MTGRAGTHPELKTPACSSQPLSQGKTNQGWSPQARGPSCDPAERSRRGSGLKHSLFPPQGDVTWGKQCQELPRFSAGIWTGLGWAPGSDSDLLTHDPGLITSLGPQFPPLRNGDNNRTSFLALLALGQDGVRKTMFACSRVFSLPTCFPLWGLPEAKGFLPGQAIQSAGTSSVRG